jgi:hypothetical protein
MMKASVQALLLACSALAVQASAATPRLLAQRGHAQCPLPGQDSRSLIIDSASMWGALLQTSEVQALGRNVQWSHERVLVHALAQQSSLGVSLKAAAVRHTARGATPQLDLRISRPKPGTAAATALSRPCVFVVLSRGPWQTLEVAVTDTPQVVFTQVSAIATKPLAGQASSAPPMSMPSTELVRPVKPVAPAASR